MDICATPSAAGGNPTVHILHHTLRRGGGMEQYALVLASSLRALGSRVIFHAHAVDVAVAREVDVEVEQTIVPRFPRKLQDLRYFRQLARSATCGEGIQIALSRVRSRDLVICGGTHRGYLKRARKIPGPFDLLQIWMEREAYRSARVVISHSDLCREELMALYAVPKEKIRTLYPPIERRFRPPVAESERTAIRQQLGLPLDKPVLLFPSMGHRRKGLKPICEALQLFSDNIVLAVAGKRSGLRSWNFVNELGFVQDMAPVYLGRGFHDPRLLLRTVRPRRSGVDRLGHPPHF